MICVFVSLKTGNLANQLFLSIFQCTGNKKNFNEICNICRKLQGNAIEKLKARETLTQSGQIELKLKLDKNIKQNHPDLENPMKIQIDTNFDGDDLVELISKKIQEPKEMLKLVSAGAVIKTNTKLSELKPGQTVMVLTVDHNSEAVKIGKKYALKK